MALAPDPFDEEVHQLLSDPELLAELERRRARRERGEAVVHEDHEVRRRLRELGVPVIDPDPAE